MTIAFEVMDWEQAEYSMPPSILQHEWKLDDLLKTRDEDWLAGLIRDLALGKLL